MVMGHSAAPATLLEPASAGSVAAPVAAPWLRHLWILHDQVAEVAIRFLKGCSENTRLVIFKRGGSMVEIRSFISA